METIGFAGLRTKVPNASKLASAPELDVAVTKVLVEYGYPAIGQESTIFTVQNVQRARMLLGGELEHLACEEVMHEPGVICDILVRWEVLDQQTRQVSYRTRTRALGLRQGRRLDGTQLNSLIADALKSLLSRDKFVSAVRKSAVQGTPGDAVYTIAEYKECSAKSMKLPRDMKKALRATVAIKNGPQTGSGVIISRDGVILTAHHVVEGAERVQYQLQNGRTGQAVVVRRDRNQDVALLRISEKLSTCLGVSFRLPGTGRSVFAIGAPGGRALRQSVTKGIVSGLRTFDGRQFIQTDASVNPGSSGGPLVDERGNIVGITSWKVVSKGFEGLGFATPAPLAISRLAITPGSRTDIAQVPAADDTRVRSLVVDTDDVLPGKFCPPGKPCLATLRMEDATHRRADDARAKSSKAKPGLRKRLGRARIRSGMQRLAGKVKACGKKHRGAGKVTVSVKVAPGGHVATAEVITTPDQTLGACIVRVVKSGTFEPTLEGASFTYPFLF